MFGAYHHASNVGTRRHEAGRNQNPYEYRQRRQKDGDPIAQEIGSVTHKSSVSVALRAAKGLGSDHASVA